MKLLNNIKSIGESNEMDLGTKKRLYVLNTISLSAAVLSSTIIAYSFLFNLDLVMKLYAVGITIILCVPTILNSFKCNKCALLLFLVTCPLLVVFLVILLGAGVHFQYFLLPLAGMPLILLPPHEKWKKRILTALTLPLFLLLQWYSTNNEAIVEMAPNVIETLRITNNILLFIILIIMFLIFTSESEDQVSTINTQNDLLEKTNTELEQFSYIVSHDLKAPLISISSFANVINKKHSQEFEPNVKKMFGYIESESKRMQDLISSILEYSKTGGSPGVSITFSCKQLFNDLLNSINLPDNMELNLPYEFPTMTTNYVQLNQVLTNLVGNAIKYHDKDNGSIEVKITNMDDLVKFEVIDNGPGIDQKYHAKLFNAYETAHSTKRSDSTGLGLAIVKKLVLLHGGELGLISNINKGSNFWFTWPKNTNLNNINH